MGSTGQLHPRATIDTLPDDVFLEIFYVYLELEEAPYHLPRMGNFGEDDWHTLVHVCRRWRGLVFAWSRHFNLRLFCTNTRPVETMLDIWPALPIVVNACVTDLQNSDATTNNIMGALEQPDRVREIKISQIPNSLLRSFVALEKPFPSLTSLVLHSNEENTPALPDSFLGGSAPRLQSLWLGAIPFPALPNLLLSTSDLVFLQLWDIPHSGYISSDAMVTSLSTLTRLQNLSLAFQSPRLWADPVSRLVPLPARVVLPALALFRYKGDSEYLEDFLARVDTPLLDNITISLSTQLTLNTPLLRHFISRTETFNATYRAEVLFSKHRVNINLFRQDGAADRQVLELEIVSDWLPLSPTQVCSSFLPPLPTLEHLSISKDDYYLPQWPGNHYIESTQWLELLHQFLSVKDLILSESLARLVAPALQELPWERVIEVLPGLQNLYLRGPPPPPSGLIREAIGLFIAARQLSGRPVAVYYGDWISMKYVDREVADR